MGSPLRTLRPAYPLETDRLILRPYAPTDLDAFHDIERRDSTARYLYNEPLTREQARAVLERRQTLTEIDEEHDGLFLAAELRADPGTPIGHFTLELKSREHLQGEIGYVIHPDHHGRGYATEGARTMLRLGFDGLGLHRIVGRLDARNDASARVLERLGMRREAHLRENEWVKGEWVSELVYAVLESEWRTAAS